MTDKNIKYIKSLINTFTIETTPNVYKKYSKFADLLDKKHKIYVTFLPDDKSENVIETSKKEFFKCYSYNSE